jgi:hypothetical protein
MFYRTHVPLSSGEVKWHRSDTSAPAGDGQNRHTLRADFLTLAPLFVLFVTGGYGVGTFFGKLFAWLLGRDRSLWGDVGGSLGGIAGLGLYLGVVVAMVSS